MGDLIKENAPVGAEASSKDIEAVVSIPEDAPAGHEPEPQVVHRDGGMAVVRMPTHGPDRDAYQEHAVFLNGGRLRDALAVCRKLWSRGLLPYMVLLIDLRPERIELGFDLPNPEAIADYQRRLDAISWGFQRPVKAVMLASSTVELADQAGLGLRHLDYVSTGGAV